MSQLTPEEIRLKQGYVIMSQKTGLSNYNGKPYTTIELIGLNDRKDYITYIQKSNQNHHQWHYITSNANSGFVVTFHNYKFKEKNDKLIIDADSVPNIKIEGELADILTEVNWYWDELEKRSNNPNYDRLFGE